MFDETGTTYVRRAQQIDIVERFAHWLDAKTVIFTRGYSSFLPEGAPVQSFKTMIWGAISL